MFRRILPNFAPVINNKTYSHEKDIHSTIGAQCHLENQGEVQDLEKSTPDHHGRSDGVGEVEKALSFLAVLYIKKSFQTFTLHLFI